MAKGELPLTNFSDTTYLILFLLAILTNC